MSDPLPGAADPAPDLAGQALRFCMVTSFYPPYNFGGDGIFVQQLALALARRGHRVTVVHCIDAFYASGGREPGPARLTHPNLEVISLRSVAGLLSPLYTQQTARPGFKARRLRDILGPGAFDVIHYHNVSLVGGAGVLAYGDAIKLYTTHEHWLLCPLSTLWKFDRQPCDSRQCVRCTLHARRPPQWWRYGGVLTRNLQHIDAFLAPSRFMIELHRRHGIEGRFELMPNFTAHTGAPDARQPGAGRQRPYFLMAGRLERSKGFQRVIRAFREFTDADLLIAGSGAMEAELRELAQGAAHIELLGWTDGERLAQLYADARAVIVPSIWQEPFGLIVAESLVRGTPVIVNDMGALAELVGESAGGLVYQDEAQLLACAQRLLQDASYRDALGHAGRESAQRLWSEESHLARYLGLVKELRATAR
ncbi:MAG: glycosyl transferase family 1 [Halioglobus sp.]|nr:glycosyl transferase family 1 [Halioglobus sp.]|tara:strand:- start:742 stop:2010 length:1269 start_codon:yes stop_codon:yes gene_type:complete